MLYILCIYIYTYTVYIYMICTYMYLAIKNTTPAPFGHV